MNRPDILELAFWVETAEEAAAEGMKWARAEKAIESATILEVVRDGNHWNVRVGIVWRVPENVEEMTLWPA